MARIAGWMTAVLRRPEDTALTERVHGEVKALCRRYPVPGIA